MSRNHQLEVLRTHQENLSEGWEEREGLWGGVAAREAGSPRPPVTLHHDPFDVSLPYPGYDYSVSLSSPCAEVPSHLSVRSSSEAEAKRLLSLWNGSLSLGAESSTMGNTSYKFTIHGAELTIWADTDTILNLFCSEYFTDFSFDDDWRRYFKEEGSTRFMGKRLIGPCGIAVLGEPRKGSGGYCQVEIPGEAFEVYGNHAFQRFIVAVHELGKRWKMRRVDAAFDGAEFTPKQVLAAVVRGNVRSLAQRSSVTLCHTPLGEEKGDTCYFGRRGSADFLRVYDRRGFTRVEHECRRRRAEVLGFQMVLVPVEQWHRLSMGNLRDFVDFLPRKVGENVTRQTRLLPWWAHFVGSVERIQIKISDQVHSLVDVARETVGNIHLTIKSFRRRAGVLLRVLGAEEFVNLIAGQAEFLRPEDHARVNAWRHVLQEFSSLFGVSVAEVVTPSVLRRSILSCASVSPPILS